jgi:hypothetical protein
LWPSSEQRKPTPELSDLKPNVAVVSVVVKPPVGPDVITTSGAVVLMAGVLRSTMRGDLGPRLRRGADATVAGSIGYPALEIPTIPCLRLRRSFRTVIRWLG